MIKALRTSETPVRAEEGVLHAASKPRLNRLEGRKLPKKKIVRSSFETLRSTSSVLRTNGNLMSKLFIILIILNTASLFALFDHDIAVSYAQKDNWKQAAECLNKSLINNPNDASLLYDAGVAAEKQKDHQQAAEYFKRAAQIATDKQIQEHSYFNLGYSLTELGKLPEAICAYEQALSIDPADERARHNLEKVKEMLKQQQQQKNDKQDKNQQQNKDKNKNQQDQQQKNSSDQNEKNDQQNDQNDQNQSGPGNKQDKQDKSQRGNKKNDQQGEQSQDRDKNQQSQSDGEQEKSKGDQQLEKEQRKEANKHGSDNEQTQRNADESKGKDAENAASNHEPQQQQHAKNEKDHCDHHGESPELEQKENPSANHHKQSPGQKQELQSVNAQEAENKNTGKKEEAPKLQAKLAAILDEQEQKDGRQTRRMMHALVNQQLAGHHGEQCW